MIAGYICLGGGQELVFPQFTSHIGSPVSPNRGRWALQTALQSTVLSIPTRDKQVQLLYNNSLAQFSAGLAFIDSDDSSLPYRSKLRKMLDSLDNDFLGVVNNKTTTSHKSLAVLTNGQSLYVVGLYDTQLKSAYLVWSNDPSVAQAILSDYPMRFLLYRFANMRFDVMFLPIESTCSRWYQWVKNGDILQAFNALELRLFGDRYRREY